MILMATFELLLFDIEKRLHREHAIADRFCMEPSAETLHAAESSSSDEVIFNLKERLRRDEEVVNRFLVQPSFDNLHQSIN